MIQANQKELKAIIKNYESIVDLYNTHNLSLDDIAKRMACETNIVFKMLKEAKNLGFSFDRPLISPKALTAPLSAKNAPLNSSNRIEIYQSIKKRIECKTDIEKYYERKILFFRKSNLRSADIATKLEISKSKVESLTKDMALRGVPIHGYERKTNTYSADDELNYANLIDNYIEQGFSLREITNLVGISRSTLQNIIYKYLM